jgi:hypothetical protein
MAPHAARARGICKFSGGETFMHRARAARPRGFDSLPSKVLQEGTLPPFCSPMTLPRWAYEELVTAHHFIGVAPMHLVEQIRAPHDYQ